MRKDKFKFRKRALACMLAVSMVVSTAAGTIVPSVTVEAAEAADLTISPALDANGNPGPTKFTIRDINDMYSFTLPQMNGTSITTANFEQFMNTFDILIQKDGVWVPIDDKDKSGMTFVANDDDVKASEVPAYSLVNWIDGAWSGYGMSIKTKEDMTYLRFQSKKYESVHLDYKFVYVDAISTMEIQDDDGDAIRKIGPGETVTFNFDFIKLGQKSGGMTTGGLLGGGLFDITVEVDGTSMTMQEWLGDGDFSGAGGKRWGYDSYPENGGYWYDIPESAVFHVKLNDSEADSVQNLEATYTIQVLADEEPGVEYNPNSPDGSREEAENSSAVDTSKYKLVWADEFNGFGNVDENGLDTSKWAYQLGDGTTVANNPGWGNAERQSYTNLSENIGVNEDLNGDNKKDGLLRITAVYDKDGHRYTGAGANPKEGTKYYTSARIVTKGTDEEPLFNTTYGYIEASMALPAKKGSWPAFWMLPQSTDLYGGWPVSGEIDIMENVGVNNDTALSTLHYGTPEHVYLGGSHSFGEKNAIASFHTYAVDWEPGKMTFYYDGQPVYTQTNWESKIAGASDSLAFDAPFDQPYYILLNLAVDSGQFGGEANKAAFTDDINMYVDYVRVYHKNEGYVTTGVRRTQNESNTDWESLIGKNQIAKIEEDTVVEADNGDVNSLETKGMLDSDKWYLAYTKGVDAEVAVEDGWAKVTINKAGDLSHSTQLIGHYDAKKGYVYKVSFDAYATGDLLGKTVTADSKEWKDWGSYGITSFELEKTPRNYSFLIDQREDFENCRIEVNLGNVGNGTAYIGNMKVEVVDPAILSMDSERSNKPLANGEMIYNGTFDQGNDRIAYWNATEGTAFVVPSYTTENVTGNDVCIFDVAANEERFYARSAEVSSTAEGVKPQIFQNGFSMNADEYVLLFDMYTKKTAEVTASLYSVKTDENGNVMLGNKLLESDTRKVTSSSKSRYAWTFEPLRDLRDAAIVLTFNEDASVNVDNVSMMSTADLGEEAKKELEDAGSLNRGENEYIEITYVLNGPDVVNSDSNPFYYIQEEGTIYLEAPTRTEDIPFAGWTLKEFPEYAEDYITEVSTNRPSLTLYAQWGEKKTESDPAIVKGVDVEDVTVEIGKTVELKPLFIPSTATTTVTWISDKEDIATVNDKGIVTGNKVGTAEITVTTADGRYTDTCFITVTPAPIPVTKVSATHPEDLKVGEELQLVVTIEPENATNKDVEWKSSNPDAVKVDANGKITALIAETHALVTVTALDGSNKYDSFIVTVLPEEEIIDAATPKVVTGTKTITITEGDAMKPVEITALKGDTGVLSYQWYFNTTASTEGGTAITGATEASYTPDSLTAGTYYYYCVVTNTNTEATGVQTATATSDVITYVVEEKIIENVDAQTPNITQQPGDVTNYVAGVDTAAPLKVTASVTDGGTLTYQWYKNTLKSTKDAVIIAGATKDTYTPDISMAGTMYYYCEVVNTNENANGVKVAKAMSNIAAITAKGVDISAPSIIGQPSNASYVYGQAATALTMQMVQPTDGTLSYQWYASTANSYSGTAIAGATGASYVPVIAAAGTTYYYCVVTNSNAKLSGIKTKSVNTAIVSVTVAKAPGAINVASEITKQYKKTSFNLNATGFGTLTYTSNTPKVATVDGYGKVTIKNTGKTTITIVAAGDANHEPTTTTVIVNVQPKKVTGFKVKSGEAGKVTVSWKKNTKATGYEIQYSTSSKFKNAKTVTITKNKSKKQSKTISKLKAGKKYYVRIRAYKNKKKAQRVYSKWTGKKKVTIKK